MTDNQFYPRAARASGTTNEREDAGSVLKSHLVSKLHIRDARCVLASSSGKCACLARCSGRFCSNISSSCTNGSWADQTNKIQEVTKADSTARAKAPAHS
jgi:hypothetical protein